MANRSGQNETSGPPRSSDANSFYPPFAKEKNYVGERDGQRSEYMAREREKINIFYKQLTLTYIKYALLLIAIVVAITLTFKYLI